MHGTCGLINPWHHLQKMSSWVGNPSRPPYVIPRGSARLKKKLRNYVYKIILKSHLDIRIYIFSPVQHYSHAFNNFLFPPPPLVQVPADNLHVPDADLHGVDQHRSDGLRLPDHGRDPRALFRHRQTAQPLRPQEVLAPLLPHLLRPL